MPGIGRFVDCGPIEVSVKARGGTARPVALNDGNDIDLDALDRRSAENVQRTTHLIDRLGELIASRQRQLDAVDRSLDRARSVTERLEVDIRDRELVVRERAERGARAAP